MLFFFLFCVLFFMTTEGNHMFSYRLRKGDGGGGG